MWIEMSFVPQTGNMPDMAVNNEPDHRNPSGNIDVYVLNDRQGVIV